MQASTYSKYALKDLHEAIDLIDRKIGYCQTYETFDSHEAQESALKKLSTKRASLVKAALALSDLGIRCDPKFLPRSFIHPVQETEQPVPPQSAADGETVRKRRTRR
jgi:hypothetical protein